MGGGGGKVWGITRLGERQPPQESCNVTRSSPSRGTLLQVERNPPMITRFRVQNFRRFSVLEIEPRSRLNILVGDNESGKSTVLQAITLALTGRWNGTWARDSLTPDWFHRPAVEAFFDARAKGNKPPPPEIDIEVYLDDPDNALQLHRGVHNTLGIDSVGLRITIAPNEEYAKELDQYLSTKDGPQVLPVEYYQVDWRSFADEPLSRTPRDLGHVLIDSRTIRSQRGVDFHTRQILHDFVEASERAAISVAQRKARHDIAAQHLAAANGRISTAGSFMAGRDVQLDFEQDSAAGWHASIVPRVDGVPFELSGQGAQAALKIALAMSRSAEGTAFVLVEEPENHLSHTSLMRLVTSIETLAGERQTFITTHSSYVLNRLGLDRLVLLGPKVARFKNLPSDTVAYFKKLSGFDTLRLVLAEKLVLVEGPSDEMLFQRFYRDRHGKLPLADGIDVVSLQGVALRRSLQLCHALGRQVLAIRDNDGKEPDHWLKSYEPLLEPGARELCIGDPSLGHTLEPQLRAVNDDAKLRKLFGLKNNDDLGVWMSKHKTDAALKVLESDVTLEPPNYFKHAFELLDE
jgi:putative ATP-dependent endonuclease of the OLD family